MCSGGFSAAENHVSNFSKVSFLVESPGVNFSELACKTSNNDYLLMNVVIAIITGGNVIEK